MNAQLLDSLSRRVQQVLQPLEQRRLNHLLLKQDPPPDRSAAELAQLPLEAIFSARVAAPDEAACVRAGLLLLLNDFDAAHRIVQDISSASGSFWHAIMHRREGDFSNARYWYARCRTHPVLPPLGERARAVAEPAHDPALRPITSGGWNGSAMVDLVEAVCRHPEDPRHATALRLQQLEWEMLLGWCIAAAVAR